MRRTRLTPLSPACILLLWGCAHRATFAPGEPRCYSVTVGAWQIPDSGRAELVPMPEVIVLYPTRIVFNPRDTSAHGLVGLSRDPEWAKVDGAFREGLSIWQQPERDRIIATFSTGYGGVRFDLRGSGATLAGTAAVFSDVIGPTYPTAPVTARPVRCPPVATQLRR